MRLAAFLLAVNAFGTDLTGIWIGSYPGRNNDPIDIAFQFKQNGDTLIGKLYGDYESTQFTEGKVSGDELTFFVIAKEQSGNEIIQTRTKFTGKLVDGALELTRERESARNASNSSAAPPLKSNTPVKMRLKRLL